MTIAGYKIWNDFVGTCRQIDLKSRTTVMRTCSLRHLLLFDDLWKIGCFGNAVMKSFHEEKLELLLRVLNWCQNLESQIELLLNSYIVAGNIFCR